MSIQSIDPGAVASKVGEPAAAKQPGIFADRTTRIGIVAIAIAVVTLIALISFITLLPIQTISASIVTQATEQLKSLSGTLARQVESHFNTLANDLIGLADREAIQSTNPSPQTNALAFLKQAGELRPGEINAIVRLNANGTPVYAWPEAYNQKIAVGEPLPWSADKTWMTAALTGNGVTFGRRSTGSDVVYLLSMPVNVGPKTREVLVFEINLADYLKATFSPVQIGSSGQIWIFDKFGSEVYHLHDQPAFQGGTAQFLNATDTLVQDNYPTADRQSIIAPVYTAFTQSSDKGSSLTIVLSRASNEGQQVVYSTLQSLFLFGMFSILVILIFGLVVGRFLLGTVNRQRSEEQRRSTARLLLEVSRAINSSLDINVVLKHILEQLERLLPHDSASILLYNAEDETVTTAAETGKFTPDHERETAPLAEKGGAREVLSTGKPAVINDCANDPRWSPVMGSNIKSWIGVPLRVRDESVGVLNINSHQKNRFTPEDIDLAEAFADQAGAAVQNARAHELQIGVYEAELETAQAIQNSLLPQESPPVPQLDVAARSLPARHVSGDYYQYFMLPDGKLGFAVGDVSGKGIPAALLMAVITTALRDEILRIPAPAALLNELNQRLLLRMQQTHMNSALLIAIFDPLTRHVEMANGGMVQPYIRSDKNWEFVPIGGYPLGASGRSSYSAKTVTLAPESMMLFITDGIVEAQNRKKEILGFDRLETLLNGLPTSSTANQVADAILKTVRDWLQGQEAQDDLTVLVVKSLEMEHVEIQNG